MITNEMLYQPEKFKVHVGKGESIGFCTVWNEPEATIQRAPVLVDRCAIVGTLYGRQGINIVLRNLALNPSIRRLYVWGFGSLSQTKFGKVGTDILFCLWQRGIEEDGLITGTSFRLEKEIDPVFVRKIIQDVELVDVSGLLLEDVSVYITPVTNMSDRKSVRFPDAKTESVDRFPSEEIGWSLRGRGVIEAWSRVVQRIMMYGNVKGTQYGSQQKELIGVTWVVKDENPDEPRLPTDWPIDLCEVTGATHDSIKQYHDVFLSPDCPPGISYTYGNRLMRYPFSEPIDQIKDVIEKSLRASPDSRRAVATTMSPPHDKDSNEPPCLTQLQFIQSHGTLHALAIFRSHDIWKAAIPNAFGLRKLQKTVCDNLGFGLGQLQITSQSAHIYESDWDAARKFVACQFTERDPELSFQAEHADPRGNILIQLREQILVTVVAPDGAELCRFEGPSARHIQRKLGLLDLFSQPDHWMDIGMELQKAEIAKQKGIPYTQDRPLMI